uniref:C-type lectin domain family 18 member A n=1 Tax=Salarias fasciatus TaxID=181472 RepID=A0A672HHP0_SALFA
YTWTDTKSCKGHIFIEWSEKLATLAKERAALCFTDSSPQRSSSHSLIGWNTHVSRHGVASFSDVVNLWENATCQHYTQLVWATSRQVGCAIQLCLRDEDLWHVFVCAYYPGGNWEVNGQLVRPYKSGLYCSLCTSDMSGCYRLWGPCGRTIPRNPCRMSCGPHGHLNVSSCKCRCDVGFTGRFCQVRCSGRCLHGRFKAEECSCLCDVGYGGPDCKRFSFPLTAVT